MNSLESTRPPCACSTVVIGAGPAGLAVAACLRRYGLSFELLEAGEAVATSWRGHYDRLHLHTNKAISRLPFVPLPKEYPRYVSRDQFVAYLESYADRFGLQARLRERVVSVRDLNGRWEVSTERNRYEASTVVVATGHAREPVVPQWPGMTSFPGTIIHSARYTNGRAFRGQRVLVVGFGNSGGEIALDLTDHDAQVSIVVRHPTNVIPRDLFGIPVLALSTFTTILPARLADGISAPVLRLLYRDIDRYGIHMPPYGAVTQTEQHQKTPLIDIGTIDRIRSGRIAVRGGITRFDGATIWFEDGTGEAYDAVILATGFRPAVGEFVQSQTEILDRAGAPVQSGTALVPGLYFCGFRLSPIGMLSAIRKEAKAIARDINQKR